MRVMTIWYKKIYVKKYPVLHSHCTTYHNKGHQSLSIADKSEVLRE